MPDQVTRTLLCAMVILIPIVSLGDELNIGSPAPQFSATMLRGNAMDKEGQIRVIEFSGTACIACMRFVPVMNMLQDTYPDIVFVSVFCEKPDEVASFLNGAGKGMRVRIATDESGRMQKDWLDAAGLEGIPQAYIVDRSGKVAWCGYPQESEFGEILKKVVEGTYDGRLDYMRNVLQRTIELNNRELAAWNEKVNDVYRLALACETPRESIQLIDKSLPDFAGCPDRIFLLIVKLDFYQKLPHSREEAYEYALSLAVAAMNERNPNMYVSACKAMLEHSEYALPENRDSRLIELALAVLLDDTAFSKRVNESPNAETDYRVDRLVVIANAHRLRGEQSIAKDRLSEAIAILKQRDVDAMPQWWMRSQRDKLAQLESMLSEWNMPVPSTQTR